MRKLWQRWVDFISSKRVPLAQPEGLAELVRENINPFRSQDNIPVRGTPVVSYWPMRDKWKKWGNAWTCLGTDGDVEKLPSGEWRLPAVLRLTYIVCANGEVCQIATPIQHEIRGDAALRENTLYNRARFNHPQEVS